MSNLRGFEPEPQQSAGRWVSLAQGRTAFEIAWLASATVVITLVSILMKDNWLGFVSAVSGVLCVVLVAKGKIANFFFGIVQTVTYAYIAYTYQLYGEAMLNALFFLPVQFVGLYLWTRHRKNPQNASRGEDVYAKRLTGRQWAVLVPAILVVSAAYAVLLTQIGAQQVRIDSVAVVVSVFAQILMTLRHAEQWIMWMVVNVLTITLWLVTLTTTGGGDWAILAMWCAYLVNSVYGWLNWRRLAAPTATTPDVAPRPRATAGA